MTRDHLQVVLDNPSNIFFTGQRVEGRVIIIIIIVVVVIIRSPNNLCPLNVIHVRTGDDSPDRGEEDEALEAQAGREGICERSFSFY